jgi:hypothetical protein
VQCAIRSWDRTPLSEPSSKRTEGVWPLGRPVCVHLAQRMRRIDRGPCETVEPMCAGKWADSVSGQNRTRRVAVKISPLRSVRHLLRFSCAARRQRADTEKQNKGKGQTRLFSSADLVRRTCEPCVRKRSNLDPDSAQILTSLYNLRELKKGRFNTDVCDILCTRRHRKIGRQTLTHTHTHHRHHQGDTEGRLKTWR